MGLVLPMCMVVSHFASGGLGYARSGMETKIAHSIDEDVLGLLMAKGFTTSEIGLLADLPTEYLNIVLNKDVYLNDGSIEGILNFANDTKGDISIVDDRVVLSLPADAQVLIDGPVDSDLHDVNNPFPLAVTNIYVRWINEGGRYVSVGFKLHEDWEKAQEIAQHVQSAVQGDGSSYFVFDDSGVVTCEYIQGNFSSSMKIVKPFANWPYDNSLDNCV